MQDLYFFPRAELARFAFIFPNFIEADQRLIQEPDESKRWLYFQRAFAFAHARARVIADHLAAHVGAVTGMPSDEGLSPTSRSRSCARCWPTRTEPRCHGAPHGTRRRNIKKKKSRKQNVANRLLVVEVAVQAGPGAEAWRDALAKNPSVHVRWLNAQEAHEALRIGKVSLVVGAGQSRVYEFDPTRPESRMARALVDDALQRAEGRTDPTPVKDQLVTSPGRAISIS